MTPEGRHANMVYLRELHKATILTKVSPKETAYGVDPHAAIEKRFTITGARQSAPARAALEQPKIVPTKRGTKVEGSSNPIIKEFMMNQELDKMLKQGAAETGPLHNATKHPTPPPDENWHTDRPPKRSRKSCGEGCRCVGGCDSAFCCGGTRSCCRGETVHGERHYCAQCMTQERETAHGRLVQDHNHATPVSKVKLEPGAGKTLLPTSVRLRALVERCNAKPQAVPQENPVHKAGPRAEGTRGPQLHDKRTAHKAHS